MTFRTKLTFISIALVVLTYLLSSFVVGVVLWSKAGVDAKREIEMASHLIREEFQSRQEHYNAQVLGFVHEESKFNQTIWFLTTYKTNAERMGVAYTTAIRDLTMTLRGKLVSFDRLRLFDPQGNVLILAERGVTDEQANLGYYLTQVNGKKQFYQAQPARNDKFEWVPAELPTFRLPFQISSGQDSEAAST